MNRLWNEAAIRAEMKKLDEQTGLSGAKLPISFDKKKHRLGAYSLENGGEFYFSTYYYDNPDWPEECAIDTIRHEYAHYMDHVLYGEVGHGETWKKCCRVVGGLPVRYYYSAMSNLHQKRHREEERNENLCGTYPVGCRIIHPRYGEGIINAIDGDAVNRRVTVEFASVGEKKLGISWVDENCRRIS